MASWVNLVAVVNLSPDIASRPLTAVIGVSTT